MNTIETIRKRFKTDRATGCLLWTGCVCTSGYGMVGFNGKFVLVHRLLWQQRHGEIPQDLEIDHICRVKLCGNLKHMELVTHCENVQRNAMRMLPMPAYRRALARRRAYYRVHPEDYF